jgi:hypothetical protein
LILGTVIEEIDTFGRVKNPLKQTSQIKTTVFGIIREDNDVHQ